MKRLDALFNFVNDRLFGSELEMPYIMVFDDDLFDGQDSIHGYQVDGLCFPHEGDYVIAIHKDAKKLDIMIHEMIHLWQMQNRKYAGHSGWFRVWCEKAYEEFYR